MKAASSKVGTEEGSLESSSKKSHRITKRKSTPVVILVAATIKRNHMTSTRRKGSSIKREKVEIVVAIKIAMKTSSIAKSHRTSNSQRKLLLRKEVKKRKTSRRLPACRLLGLASESNQRKNKRHSLRRTGRRCLKIRLPFSMSE